LEVGGASRATEVLRRLCEASLGSLCDGEKVIGRIVRHPQAPKKAPWFWTIIAEGRKRSLSDRGYAVSRE
jgi:hypothetical protein